MKKLNFWLGVGLTLALNSLAAVHYYTDVPNNPNPLGTYAVSLDTGDHNPGGTPYNWISIDQLSARIGSASTVGFLRNLSDNGTNESFWNGTTFSGTGAAVELQTGTILYGNLQGGTNLQSAFALISADPNEPNARRLVAGANITFTDGGAGSTLTISSSGTNVVQTVTNNTFVNTNIMILQSNATFTVKRGATVVFETNAFLIDSNITANSAVITDSIQNITNAANAVGVFTNSAGGPPSFGLVANNLLQNSSITIQGSAVALGGSTLAAGSSPFFNAANITNVQMGTVVGGSNTWQFDGSFMWPGDTLAATWTTNTPGAGSASIQSAGPSIKAWQISTSATNQVLLQVPMPANWDAGAVTFWINLIGGTNSAAANAITNTWGVSAARAGTSLGTAILITNNLPGGTGLISTNFDFPGLVIAGSPKPGDYCLFQIQGRGGVTPFSSTNLLLLTSCGIRYGITNIQNNAIQWP